jgi:ATP-dependent DNA helicase DinG
MDRPMHDARDLIDRAFQRLAQSPGFVERPDQVHLSHLLGDLIEERSSGIFEAPTGLGKSLAALVPAIAHAIVGGRRTVVATYTNVLAEQYWRNDLPLALSLFDDLPPPTCEFLIGRQRYACLIALDEHAPELVDPFRAGADLGIETEFRALGLRPAREAGRLWGKVAAPPVCNGRLCPAYQDCFYYRARREAEKAQVVITNHSVVLQDAKLATASDDGVGLLGPVDFLILDEAHDFYSAALSAFEFELSGRRLDALLGVAARMEKVVLGEAARRGEAEPWQRDVAAFRERIERSRKDLAAYSMTLGRAGILKASPSEVMEHPNVKGSRTPAGLEGAQELALAVGDACDALVKGLDRRLERWRDEEPERVRPLAESVRNYGTFLREYGVGCLSLFDPGGVSVSYVGGFGGETSLRHDLIGLDEPLRGLIWDRTPTACLSATLAVDGNFEFFRRTTGAVAAFEEVLPSPFDFESQAALYLPPPGTIPDPAEARRGGVEETYWRAVAAELSRIVRAMGGRTLALFHSRKEMEGVYGFMDLPPELPLYVQMRGGAGATGERFLRKEEASLFALRSFWTGFDAPGPTLSCVALVRIPFEVPIDPPQIVRLAHLQAQGLDAFREHSLPQAKMLIRQGAGRLIRRADDRGVVAILDPRLTTKRFGEEIQDNLPPEMRVFRDLMDAMGWVGLEAHTCGSL